jgi:hypothetical protein
LFAGNGMLYGEISLHADDDEDENGCCVAKRVNEMIGFAHEGAPDPTAKKERKKEMLAYDPFDVR